MNPRLLAWRTATGAWAGQIYWMSASARLSSDHTRSYLAVLFARWLGWQPEASILRTIGWITRKGAHVTEYALLAFLLFHALEGLLDGRQRRAKWSLAITAAYALSDEFHQMFVPGRGASLVDWGIDFAGALLATWLVVRHCPPSLQGPAIS